MQRRWIEDSDHRKCDPGAERMKEANLAAPKKALVTWLSSRAHAQLLSLVLNCRILRYKYISKGTGAWVSGDGALAGHARLHVPSVLSFAAHLHIYRALYDARSSAACPAPGCMPGATACAGSGSPRRRRQRRPPTAGGATAVRPGAHLPGFTLCAGCATHSSLPCPACHAACRGVECWLLAHNELCRSGQQQR